MHVYLCTFFWRGSLWLSSDPQKSSEPLSIMTAIANLYLVFVCQALRNLQVLSHTSPNCNWARAGQRVVLPTPLLTQGGEKKTTNRVLPVLVAIAGALTCYTSFVRGREFPPRFPNPSSIPSATPSFPKGEVSFATLGLGKWARSPLTSGQLVVGAAGKSCSQLSGTPAARLVDLSMSDGCTAQVGREQVPSGCVWKGRWPLSYRAE